MFLEDNWFGLDGVQDNHPFILRGRENLNGFRATNSYRTRIDILWTYYAVDESLMPDEKDLELMTEVENTLVEQLEADLQAILSLVYTGNKTRIWYFYCKNSEETGRRINIALSQFSKLPIDIFSYADPEWEEYNNVID